MWNMFRNSQENRVWKRDLARINGPQGTPATYRPYTEEEWIEAEQRYRNEFLDSFVSAAANYKAWMEHERDAAVRQANRKEVFVVGFLDDWIETGGPAWTSIIAGRRGQGDAATRQELLVALANQLQTRGMKAEASTMRKLAKALARG